MVIRRNVPSQLNLVGLPVRGHVDFLVTLDPERGTGSIWIDFVREARVVPPGDEDAWNFVQGEHRVIVVAPLDLIPNRVATGCTRPHGVLVSNLRPKFVVDLLYGRVEDIFLRRADPAE